MTDSENVPIPGGRDVRATLDHGAIESDGDGGSELPPNACVVACPPHPQHGGHRGDQRLEAVSTAVADGGVDCLRFDYGEWDEGYGELADTDNALAWAFDRYAEVGLFGYSFGGCLALVAAADREDLSGVAALAPAPRLNPDVDAVAALDDIECPIRIVHGTRDTTTDSESLVERAREIQANRPPETITEVAADHFFIGQVERVGKTIGEWFLDRFRSER